MSTETLWAVLGVLTALGALMKGKFLDNYQEHARSTLGHYLNVVFTVIQLIGSTFCIVVGALGGAPIIAMIVGLLVGVALTNWLIISDPNPHNPSNGGGKTSKVAEPHSPPHLE